MLLRLNQASPIKDSCAQCAQVMVDLKQLGRLEDRKMLLVAAFLGLLAMLVVMFDSESLAASSWYYAVGATVSILLCIVIIAFIIAERWTSRLRSTTMHLGLMSEHNGALHLHCLDDLPIEADECDGGDGYFAATFHRWVIRFTPEDLTNGELLVVTTLGVIRRMRWRVAIGDALRTLTFHDAHDNTLRWRMIPQTQQQDLHRHVDLAVRFANLDHFLEQAADVAQWSEDIYVRLLAIHLFIVESGAHVRGGLAREIYEMTNASLRSMKEVHGRADEIILVQRAQTLLQELRSQLNLKHGPRQEQTT